MSDPLTRALRGLRRDGARAHRDPELRIRIGLENEGDEDTADTALPNEFVEPGSGPEPKPTERPDWIDDVRKLDGDYEDERPRRRRRG